MLPRSQRLTTTQFDHAFANSQTLRHPLASVRVHWRSDGEAPTRAAFVVPKKQAKKATQRNLVRRRLRERYRLLTTSGLEAPRGCDLIFMSTAQTATASAADLDAALRDLLERAGKRSPRDNPRSGASAAEPVPERVIETVELPLAVMEGGEPAAVPALARLSLPASLGLTAIRFYQRFISPGLPPSCRFEPTCSRYTYTSIERFGLIRGSFLGASRICKCHPWHEGGFDPVPQIFPDLLSKRPNKKKFSMRLFRSKDQNGASL